MGGRNIRGLKARVGQGCCISRGGPDGQIEQCGIQAGGILGGSHNVGRCGISRRSKDATGRAAPGARAARSYKSRKGEE